MKDWAARHITLGESARNGGRHVGFVIEDVDRQGDPNKQQRGCNHRSPAKDSLSETRLWLDRSAGQLVSPPPPQQQQRVEWE